MRCEIHDTVLRERPRPPKKRALPCPWLRCPNGARGLWVVVKAVVYVRRRLKDAWGPLYYWEKTDLDPIEIQHAPDDEEEDLVF